MTKGTYWVQSIRRPNNVGVTSYTCPNRQPEDQVQANGRQQFSDPGDFSA